MGMLDALLENPELLGNVAKFTADNPEIAKAAMNFLSSSGGSGGGLGEIVGALQSGGLADAVSSWLGGGDNLAVAPGDLKSAPGADRIAEFAKQAGVSGSEASAVLAGILPQIVDKLSPDGKLPDAGGVDGMLGGLMGMLGK